jgi:integrase
LTLDEVKLLLKTPLECENGPEIKAAFIFACMTGLRISDLCRVCYSDISYPPLKIVIRQHKTGEVVSVPISEAVFKLIAPNATETKTGLIFPNLKRIAYRKSRPLEKWADLAGIKKKVHWHMARHTFAINALQEGGSDIYTLSKLLGHTNIRTTEVYAKCTDKMKARVTQTLSCRTFVEADFC